MRKDTRSSTMNDISFKPELMIREARKTRMVATSRGKGRWTAEEIATVVKWWPDVANCAAKTGRSAYAIKQKAQALGIRKKNNRWATTDKIWLRHNWNTAPRTRLFERFPGRSYDDITHKAREMGLPVRGMPPPVTCGHPVVDAVRAKAYELGLTMRRLDELAGTGAYWQSHSPLTCDKRTTTDHMLRTVKALGGCMAVTWE